jgi:DNA-binding SARP family transcriptional activator
VKPLARFRLLGPLSVCLGGEPVEVGHPRQRCVLAVLLTEAGRPVPTGTLVDRVWGDNPPPTARNAVYTYVTQLRAALVPLDVPIVKRSSGYVIGVEPDAVDMHRFHGLVGKAKKSHSDVAAVDFLAEALDLSRGMPFDDLHTPWIDMVRSGLLAQRRSVLLRVSDLLLRLNRHAEALHGLHEAAVAAPLDESLAEQLMLALYRSGQLAAALGHYHEVRRALAEELGVSPSPQLQEFYQKLLRGDPSLAAPPSGGASIRRHDVHRPRAGSPGGLRPCARCATGCGTCRRHG